MVNKVAIVLQAGSESHEGVARALHALLYARELTERGGTARIVFDGAGTEWLARFRNPDSDSSRRLAGMFDQMKRDGLVYEVCDFCSGAFGVKGELTDEPMSGKYMDHPSIVDLVEEGHQIWIL
jgi:sulfur relay (sulfurtransferase) complex TusBCD TusD component (DsrE family)